MVAGVVGAGLALFAVFIARSLSPEPAAFSTGLLDDAHPVFVPKSGLAQAQTVAAISDTEWLVGFTVAMQESGPDQTVEVSRTTDAGRTWSPPAPVEPETAGGHPAGWVQLAFIPGRNRVYAFYFWNETGTKRRDGTDIFVRTSDDHGATWSDRVRVPMPAFEISSAFPERHGWFMDRPILTSRGTLVLGFSLIDPATLAGDPDHWRTEVFFLRIPEVEKVTDLKESDFNVTPAPPRGLYVNHPTTGLPYGQEPSVAEYDGKLIVVFRNRTGHLYFATSTDDGVTWSEPDALRFYPGGPPLLQPNAPAIIRPLPDGRVVLLFNNNPGGAWFVKGKWSEGWIPRYPVYMTIGTPGKDADNAGLIFSNPGEFLRHEGAFDDPKVKQPSYPSLERIGDRYYVFYSITKEGILFKEVPISVIDRLSPRPFYKP
jgi:hypothetical protein